VYLSKACNCLRSENILFLLDNEKKKTDWSNTKEKTLPLKLSLAVIFAPLQDDRVAKSVEEFSLLFTSVCTNFAFYCCCFFCIKNRYHDAFLPISKPKLIVKFLSAFLSFLVVCCLLRHVKKKHEPFFSKSKLGHKQPLSKYVLLYLTVFNYADAVPSSAFFVKMIICQPLRQYEKIYAVCEIFTPSMK